MCNSVTAGDIHIWDRRSGYMLHSFQAQDLDNDLTCIAWNHAVVAPSPFMFATGSHDGTVRVWMSITNPLQQLPSRSSYLDLRQSGGTTPRTVTPEPPALSFQPTFTLEVMDGLDSGGAGGNGSGTGTGTRAGGASLGQDRQLQRLSRDSDALLVEFNSLRSSPRSSCDGRPGRAPTPTNAGTS